MSWILVFWLHYPENYTVLTKYSTERECRDAEYSWNRRLQVVRSELKAECRHSD